MKSLITLLSVATTLLEVKALAPCENFAINYNNRCGNVACTQNSQCQSYECTTFAICKDCTNTDAPGGFEKCEGNQCEDNLECKQSLCYKGYCDV